MTQICEQEIADGQVPLAGLMPKRVRLMRDKGTAAISMFVFILFAFASGGAMAAGDAAAGAAKAHTCLGCHGVKHYVNTYPTYHVPRLGGQNEGYLVSALQSYRGKLRGHQSMQANAGLLTDQDIEDISAYMATVGTEFGDKQKKSNEKQAADMPEIAKTCSACHGSDGIASIPTYPILAGQYKSYIKQALLSYRNGERENAIMSGFAAALSDADIKALAAYFSGMKSPLQTVPIP